MARSRPLLHRRLGRSNRERRRARWPSPHGLHPMAFTPWPSPHGLHPMASTPWPPPHGLHPMASTPWPPPHGLHPMAFTPWPSPHGLHPMASTPWPSPHGLHPMASTPWPSPHGLHPHGLHPMAGQPGSADRHGAIRACVGRRLARGVRAPGRRLLSSSPAKPNRWPTRRNGANGRTPSTGSGEVQRRGHNPRDAKRQR
jgi:hypothetical protein